MTAAHVNLDLGVWIFKEHKTAKRTGRPRVDLPDAGDGGADPPADGEIPGRPALPRAAEQARLYPQRRPLPLPQPPPEAAAPGRRHQLHDRHSFATQALVNGVGIAHVAELMGHVDTSMVSQHYAHLAGNVQHMREAAKKAAGNS